MRTRTALLALSATLSGAAVADTGYYLVSAYDRQGQVALDYQYWNAHYADHTTAAPEIGLAYGVTSRWYTEVYVKWVKRNGAAPHMGELAWQNDYMLTQGQYAWDVAMHTRIGKARNADDGYSLEWGPVMQTEVWRTQFNVNLFLQRDYHMTGAAGPTELVYQLQVKQRWKSWLQPGLQAFGEVGKWNDWSLYKKQSHRAGPALFGYRDIGRQQITYEAAYLIGRNAARAAKSFTMRVQYIF